MRSGWALKGEQIQVSWGQGRGPRTMLQPFRGVGRVCLVFSVRVASHVASRVASHLSEALAVAGRIVSESPQRGGAWIRPLWLRQTVH